MRRRWTKRELAVLRARYPHEPTAKLARALGHPLPATYRKAAALGLRKSAAYLASPHACRLRRGDGVGAATRFQKGHVPANKGLRRPGYGPGRMRDTQFRKGERHGVAAARWVPIGTLRENGDGYIDMKVREAPGARAWRALHRILWEDAHGPVPAGHAVCFRNGDRLDVELANLDLVPRRELARRNHWMHRLPPAIAGAMTALGALRRAITMKEKRGRHG